MGTLVSIVKVIMFLFPFVKEIFIGKDIDPVDRRKRPSTFTVMLKKFLALLVCVSLVMNYYLVTKVFDLGKKNIELKKQLADKPRQTIEPAHEKAPLPPPSITPGVDYTAPKKPKPPKPKPPDVTTKPEDDILVDLEEIRNIR